MHKTLAILFTAAASTLLLAQTTPKRPAITGIAHMTVFDADAAAAKTFYVGELGFASGTPDASGEPRFYASPTQYVVVAPLPAEHTNSRLKAVYFRTADAEALRRYLQTNAYTVPPQVTRNPDGTVSFELKDPDGNVIGFEQGTASQAPVPSSPTSTRMIHVGFAVQSRAAEDTFYQMLLGFRPYWHGAMKDGATDDWVSLQVPEGTDWLEYMLTPQTNPSQRALGVLNHFSLGVVDINDAAARLQAHGWHETQGEKRQEGRDGKRQLNVFDPDQTRVEFMEFTNFREPCCSAFTAANPKP